MSRPEPESVTLIVEDDNGNRESLVLNGPGGECRFSVGDPECHAAIWKVWSNKNNASVYAAIRVLGDKQKVSLHEGPTGSDWRLQWTSEHMDATPELKNRIIDRWDRPSEIGDTGWTKGLTVWVRHQDVVPAPTDEHPPTDVLWLPTPPEGHATGVHLVIARPTNRSVRPKGIPLGGITLADGQVALLVLSRSAVGEDANRMLRNGFAKLAQAAQFDRDEPGVFRMLLWSSGPEGDRQAWDVAVREASDGTLTVIPPLPEVT